MCRALFAALLAVLVASAASAAIVVPGAEGWDGPFAPTGASYVVDLSKAATGQWDGTPEVPGNGVYDPEKWAVVFKYESVNVPAGCTVTFKNHPSRAPVVWLVSGDVTIAGSVNLNGENSQPNGVFGEPGPGGFRGGAGTSSLGNTPGLGPGGAIEMHGRYYDRPGHSTGSYATVGYAAAGTAGEIYGNAAIVPLIGGSGGFGDYAGPNSGGGGGGALLVASTNSVSLTGSLICNGGQFNLTGDHRDGSGGAIRLVADSVLIAGTIQAVGRDGGVGRIRLEANSLAMPPSGVAPSPSIHNELGASAALWPDAGTPRIVLVSIGEKPIPRDPQSSLVTGQQDVGFASGGSKRLVVRCENVPPDWRVRARLAGRGWTAVFVNMSRTDGDEALSTWEGDVPLSDGCTAIQVRASAQ